MTKHKARAVWEAAVQDAASGVSWFRMECGEDVQAIDLRQVRCIETSAPLGDDDGWEVRFYYLDGSVDEVS